MKSRMNKPVPRRDLLRLPCQVRECMSESYAERGRLAREKWAATPDFGRWEMGAGENLLGGSEVMNARLGLAERGLCIVDPRPTASPERNCHAVKVGEPRRAMCAAS